MSRTLSPAQVRLLTDLFTGGHAPLTSRNRRTRMALINLGLVQHVHDDVNGGYPAAVVLTEAGRALNLATLSHRVAMTSLRGTTGAMRLRFVCTCGRYDGLDETTGATEREAMGRARDHIATHARDAGYRIDDVSDATFLVER